MEGCGTKHSLKCKSRTNIQKLVKINLVDNIALIYQSRSSKRMRKCIIRTSNALFSNISTKLWHHYVMIQNSTRHLSRRQILSYLSSPFSYEVVLSLHARHLKYYGVLLQNMQDVSMSLRHYLSFVN